MEEARAPRHPGPGTARRGALGIRIAFHSELKRLLAITPTRKFEEKMQIRNHFSVPNSPR
jgi:hypothetical protein